MRGKIKSKLLSACFFNEYLKPDPSAALPSYPLFRMTFLSEIIQRMILIWWRKSHSESAIYLIVVRASPLVRDYVIA